MDITEQRQYRIRLERASTGSGLTANLTVLLPSGVCAVQLKDFVQIELQRLFPDWEVVEYEDITHNLSGG